MWLVIILLCAYLNVTSTFLVNQNNYVHQPKPDFNFVDFQYNKDFDGYNDNPDLTQKGRSGGEPVTVYDDEDDDVVTTHLRSGGEPVTDYDAEDDHDDDVVLEYPANLADDNVLLSFPGDIDIEDDDNEIPEKEKPCHYGVPNVYPYPKKIINRAGRTVSDIKCEEYMWDLKHKVIDAEDNKKKCDKAKGITLVIGGKETGKGEYPHMGAVAWIINGKNVFGCGCSLISPTYAITAAHCQAMSTYAAQNIKDESLTPKFVRFGSATITGGNNTEDRKDINISKFIRHKSHSHHIVYYDIGLIRLTEEVTITANLRPACLWSQGTEQLSTAIITGWGKSDTVTDNPVSSSLLQAEVSIKNWSDCDELLYNKRNRHFCHGIVKSQICAVSSQRSTNVTFDACKGDSGGPLQIKQTAPMASNAIMHHLVGIVSFGIECAKEGLPGVYTDIGYYRCWIEKKVWPEERNSCKEPDPTPVGICPKKNNIT